MTDVAMILSAIAGFIETDFNPAAPEDDEEARNIVRRALTRDVFVEFSNYQTEVDIVILSKGVTLSLSAFKARVLRDELRKLFAKLDKLP